LVLATKNSSQLAAIGKAYEKSLIAEKACWEIAW
jgi:hypothetical protein